MTTKMKRPLARLITFLFIMGLLGSSLVKVHQAGAQVSPSITFVGNISGAGAPNFMDGTRDVHVSGNHAFVVTNQDDAFNVVNVSNPSSPTLAASVRGFQPPHFLSSPSSIDIVGNLAYVLSNRANVNESGITIFDISQPANPAVAGHLFSEFFGNANTIRVNGNYAYVVQGPNSWVSVIDVSNPSTSFLVSVLTLDPIPQAAFPFDIDFSGNYAFVPGANNDTLYVIDISNPSSLQISATLTGAGAPTFLDSATGVRVLENYAFVTAGFDNSLTVVDISNPLTPAVVSHIAGAGAPNFLGGARHLHLSGNLAFVVAGADNALTAIDISNPLAPNVVASVQGAGAPNFLNIPLDVFISGNYAYVAAFADDSLSIFDTSILFLSPVPLFKWGSFGTGLGQFNNPDDIAIDSQGNVYVLDGGNDRVQKFDRDGNFLLDWGSTGAGAGQFDFFVNEGGIAVDAADYVYVTDSNNNRIQKFDSNGNLILQWTAGFFKPRGIAVDPTSDDVWVADTSASRQVRFTNNGTFVLQVQADAPFGIDVDSEGNVYTAFPNHLAYRKMDSNGNPLQTISIFNLRMSPKGIAIGPGDFVHVSSWQNEHKVAVFTNDGMFLTQFGSFGTGDGQFDSPRGLAVNNDGIIYVADFNNHRIQVFTSFLPPSVIAALALAGIEIGAVPQDVLNGMVVAAHANVLTEIAPNSVFDANISLGSGEVLVAEAGAFLNGNISGDGTNSIVLGDDTRIDGNVSNIDKLFVGGTNVIFDGNYSINVRELIVGSGAGLLIKGNVVVDRLVVEEGGSLHIEGNLTVRKELALGADAFLQVDGKLRCSSETIVTKDPTATVIVIGDKSCSGL